MMINIRTSVLCGNHIFTHNRNLFYKVMVHNYSFSFFSKIPSGLKKVGKTDTGKCLVRDIIFKINAWVRFDFSHLKS